MVERFMAAGPWITRDLKPCVLASDYDALEARVRKLEAYLMEARDLLYGIPTPVDDVAWEEKRGGWSDGLHNI